MSYESKLYIVNRSVLERPGCEPYVFADVIAICDMHAMGYSNGFHELFTNETDYDLFIDGVFCDSDQYGDHLKYAPIDSVIEWLDNQTDDYRRLPVLRGLLSGFDPSQWDELQVVHYGY